MKAKVNLLCSLLQTGFSNIKVTNRHKKATIPPREEFVAFLNYIEEDIKEFERLLNDREDLKNDHEFVAHCHRIIALIKQEKSLNVIRGLYIDIANKMSGGNVRHEKCGVYNYPAYQYYQKL